MWIIKVGQCFVGNHNRLVSQEADAYKWRYKRDASIESIFWLGKYMDGTAYSVTVSAVGAIPANKTQAPRV